MLQEGSRKQTNHWTKVMFLLFLEHKYETFPYIITCLPFICTNLPLEELLWHWNWGGTKIIQPASQKIELKSWPKCLEMLPHPYGPLLSGIQTGVLWFGLPFCDMASESEVDIQLHLLHPHPHRALCCHSASLGEYPPPGSCWSVSSSSSITRLITPKARDWPGLNKQEE